MRVTPFDVDLTIQNAPYSWITFIGNMINHLGRRPVMVWPTPENDTDSAGAFVGWSRGQPQIARYNGAGETGGQVTAQLDITLPLRALR